MGPSSEGCHCRSGRQRSHNPSVLVRILSNSGVTCDSNGLSKMATRPFHQEVVSRMVTDAEGQQSANG